ncbi:MAG: glycoside hydrolase N-terminal domain-containing protein, partial [Puniceicoccales bacterium]|nr:glycoside hydrolase N-terminal domain-containing protein [Puniceicoccales bacterium]
STDGDPSTKWCIEAKSFPIIWQKKFTAPIVLKSYAITSAGDVPDRDPRNWKLEASDNGTDWTTLDRQALNAPFAKRGETYTYPVNNNNKGYSYYRLVFADNHNNASHFQVAEIALPAQGNAKKSTGSQANGYRRDLDISNATATTTFVHDGARHTREIFASHPDDLIVIRWTADKPGSINGVVEMKGAHNEKPSSANNEITFGGTLENNLKYRTILRAIPSGGKVTATNNTLVLEKCDSVLFLMDARTDYLMDPDKNWRGSSPESRLKKTFDGVSGKSFDTLKQHHIADYISLYGRATFDIGTTSDAIAALPTDKRLRAYRNGGVDPDLEETLFQMGRYLLIASSRRPGLPANLQGLWCDSNNPAWHSDYHTNINVQMNYWPAETANLSECHLPFFDLSEAIVEPSRKATRGAFGEGRGFTMRTSHNIFGGNGWQWNLPSSAWYAQHFAEHYRFTLDREFLKKSAYPYVKDVCEFWVDHLKKLPDGRYVIPNGWSPEHGPREDGVAHDQQIVWDLFDNYLYLANQLDKSTDAAFREKVTMLRDNLVGPQIGRWGQLMEWMVDRDDPNTNHRHTSHLFAVYPGSQISVTKTPEWAKAAEVSLKARGTSGDSRREWAWAWRSNLWARLQNAERAYAMVRGLIAQPMNDRNEPYNPLNYNTLDNLFGNHPPMQLDGNWGITAGMVEMVLQSHADEIHLLPALPKEWANGSFQGLRARGDFTVDAEWKNGQLVSYKIASPTPRKVKVRIGNKVEEITAKKL